MKLHIEDRGLDAVRRVRSSRESDSRIGLQQALTQSRASAAAASAAASALASYQTFAAGSSTDFLRHRQHLAALATGQRTAETVAQRSANVADEARNRWLRDRTAVHSVDLLLERRRAERAAERARREGAELDDLSASRWLRAVTDAEEGGR